MSDASRDLDAAGPASSRLADDRYQVVFVLDDLFGLDAKVVEALEPGTQEALERFSASVLSGLRAGLILLPCDLRV